MHKLILAAAICAVLAGCASHGSMARDGRTHSDPYRSTTGSLNDSSQPYYDDRYWPPVVPGQAFPPQIMDGGSPD